MTLLLPWSMATNIDIVCYTEQENWLILVYFDIHMSMPKGVEHAKNEGVCSIIVHLMQKWDAV